MKEKDGENGRKSNKKEGEVHRRRSRRYQVKSEGENDTTRNEVKPEASTGAGIDNATPRSLR